MTDVKLPRGIRNNNPGNIRIGQNWQGEASNNTDGSFEQFSSAQYGIRAITKILQSYSKQHIYTIRTIIDRWAPPTENDTESYINNVSKSSGYGVDDCLNMQSPEVMSALVKAIIFHENGQQPYSDDIINEGVHLGLTT